MEEGGRDTAGGEARGAIALPWPRAERGEHGQRRRFRDLLEAAPDAIFEVDRDGAIVVLNTAAETMFGYAGDELAGRSIKELVPDSLRQRHRERRERNGGGAEERPMERGLELLGRRKDGGQFPVEIHLSPVGQAEGSHAITVVRDLAGRPRAEERTNAMYRQFAAELAATNRQLEIRVREAERANRIKTEFLASMSHELRTPLHAAIGFADLLAEETKGPLNADQKRFTGHIQTESRHLLELINDILDLSKIESGKLELHPKRFQATKAIQEVLDGVRCLAENKRITIGETLDREIAVTADYLRFKEIIYNLASNVIAFTPEAGRIEVECREHPEGVYVCVADNGAGIHASRRESIFERFCHVGTAEGNTRESTGLGLSITRNLVRLHGGRIWVDSEPGEGSRFQFVLPVPGAGGGGERSGGVG